MFHFQTSDIPILYTLPHPVIMTGPLCQCTSAYVSERVTAHIKVGLILGFGYPGGVAVAEK